MAKNRDKFQREKDLVVIESLYLKRIPQATIAEKIGVTPRTIANDLKTLRTRWKNSCIRDLDEAKGKELAKIDHLEMEYWEAWERSKCVERDGDPRFLQGVERCIERRCKVLGLDAPKKLEHSGEMRTVADLIIRADEDDKNTGTEDAG